MLWVALGFTISTHDPRHKECSMNIRPLAIVLSVMAVAGAAMAVEAEQSNPPPGIANRADVKVELRRAAANGELAAKQGEAYGGFDYGRLPPSALTRAEVKQELARARANGELPVVNEAYSGFVEPSAPNGRGFAGRKSQTDPSAGGKSGAM